jgi:beta-glucosidase
VLTPVVNAKELIRARIRVHNTGTRPAVETVQVYVSDAVTSATWAAKELKSYEQVTLAPGETRSVEIELPAAVCTLVNADGERIVEPGAFELLIGPSSRDEDLLRADFTVES